MKDGILLGLAVKAGFDVFITVDAGIEYQQNLSAVPLRIVALRAISNRLEDTEPIIPKILPKILEVLESLEFGVHVF